MKAKREYNALHFLLGCLAVSIILGFLLGSTSLGVVWYVVTSLVVAAISFFVLFWLGVIVTVIFRMKIKGGAPIPYQPLLEEEPEYIPKRKKKPQVDVFDDDDYDYIYGRGRYERKKPRSAMTFLERLRDNRGY